MISFANDYSEGAIPQIIEALTANNLNQYSGYGMDEICAQAKDKIKKVLECDNCDIHFLVGGTQTNATVIDHALKPYEAVIACESGHINVHETGAIEANGHKVIVTPSVNGKILPQDIYKAYKLHSDEHMVKPAMVYLSNASELGSVYHYDELKAIKAVCNELGLYLFLDGARLAVALCAKDNDLKMSDLANLCDIFYIGGTKNGALMGEAVVIINETLKRNFRYSIKQHGGMLAKGWLLGIQFNCLFTDNIYFEIAKHANKMANKIQNAFKARNVSLLLDSTTNQVFPILNKELAKELAKDFTFQVWEEIDDSTCVYRFVTSWATTESNVDALIGKLEQLIK